MKTNVIRFISVDEADILPDKRRIRELETEVSLMHRSVSDSLLVQQHLENIILQLMPSPVAKSCGVCGHYSSSTIFHTVSAAHIQYATAHGLLLTSAWTCEEHADACIIAQSAHFHEMWTKFSHYVRASRETDVKMTRKLADGLQFCAVCGDRNRSNRSLPFWALSTGVVLGLPVISGGLCPTCATSRIRSWFTDKWAEHAACLRTCYLKNGIRLAKYAPTVLEDSYHRDAQTPTTPHAGDGSQREGISQSVDRAAFLQKLKEVHPLARMTSDEALSLDLDQVQSLNMMDFARDAIQHCQPVLDEICGLHAPSCPKLSDDDKLRCRIGASFFWFALEGIKNRKCLQGFRSLFGVGLDSVRSSQHTLLSIVHRHLGLTASSQQTRKILQIHENFRGLTEKQKDEIATGMTLPVQSWDNLENYEKKAGSKNVFTSGVSHIVVSSPNLASCISPAYAAKIHPVLDDHWRNLYPSLHSPSVWQDDFMSQEHMKNLFMPNLLPYAGDTEPRCMHLDLQASPAPGVLAFKKSSLKALQRLNSIPGLINQVRLADAVKEQKHILSVFPSVFEKRTNQCVQYLKDTKANKKDHIEDVIVESIGLLQRNGVLEYCVGERPVAPPFAPYHPRCITLEMDVGMEIGLQKKLAEDLHAEMAAASNREDLTRDASDGDSEGGDDMLGDSGGISTLQESEMELSTHIESIQQAPKPDTVPDGRDNTEEETRKRVHLEKYLPVSKYLPFIRNVPAHFHVHMKALNCVITQLFPVFNYVISELCPSSQKILRAEQQFYDNLQLVQTLHSGLLELLIETVVRFDLRFSQYFDEKCGALLLSTPEEVTMFLADVYYYYYYCQIQHVDVPMQLVMGFLFETGPMVLEMKDACGNGNTPFMEANFGRALALIGGQNHPNYRKSMLRDLV
ncbi:MAG: hypothetical protein Q7U84_06075, partial [Polynucleobacter sp.]|nr:hypothetical protein [Polynucleobacter sp.]